MSTIWLTRAAGNRVRWQGLYRQIITACPEPHGLRTTASRTSVPARARRKPSPKTSSRSGMITIAGAGNGRAFNFHAVRRRGSRSLYIVTAYGKHEKRRAGRIVHRQLRGHSLPEPLDCRQGHCGITCRRRRARADVARRSSRQSSFVNVSMSFWISASSAGPFAERTHWTRLVTMSCAVARSRAVRAAPSCCTIE